MNNGSDLKRSVALLSRQARALIAATGQAQRAIAEVGAGRLAAPLAWQRANASVGRLSMAARMAEATARDAAERISLETLTKISAAQRELMASVTQELGAAMILAFNTLVAAMLLPWPADQVGTSEKRIYH